MNKYVFNLENIKERLKSLRQSRGDTQVKVAEGIHVDTGTSRTTITTWENKSNQVLPDIRKFIDLCNYFEVDMDYILGRTNVKSYETKTVSEMLNISETVVNDLKHNLEYGKIIDSFLSDELLPEIVRRIHQLGNSFVLEDIITTTLKKDLIDKIHRLFDKYYYNAFPMDMSSQGFEEYLICKIPYTQKFNPQKYIQDNFFEDGKTFIYNKFDNYHKANAYEKYRMIISSIVDICYDYFMSTQVIALSKQRLYNTISTVFENIIEEEATVIRENMNTYANKKSEVF